MVLYTRRFYTNNTKVEGLVNDPDLYAQIATFSTLDDVKPDDHTTAFLFDICHIPFSEYELTEERLHLHNPDWFDKHWAFVKGMYDVYLFQHRWFEYHHAQNKFVICDKPDLEGDAAIVTGDEVALSFSAVHALESLFSCLTTARDLIEDDIVNPFDLKVEDTYDYKRLCDRLVRLLYAERETSEFWFAKTRTLVRDYGCDICREEWDALEASDMNLYDKELREFRSSCNDVGCCYVKGAFFCE